VPEDRNLKHAVSLLSQVHPVCVTATGRRDVAVGCMAQDAGRAHSEVEMRSW